MLRGSAPAAAAGRSGQVGSTGATPPPPHSSTGAATGPYRAPPAALATGPHRLRQVPALLRVLVVVSAASVRALKREKITGQPGCIPRTRRGRGTWVFAIKGGRTLCHWARGIPQTRNVARDITPLTTPNWSPNREKSRRNLASHRCMCETRMRADHRGTAEKAEPDQLFPPLHRGQ